MTAGPTPQLPPIQCQTRRCQGELTEDEALASLREHGRALCAACLEEAARDGAIDDATDRAMEASA